VVGVGRHCRTRSLAPKLQIAWVPSDRYVSRLAFFDAEIHVADGYNLLTSLDSQPNAGGSMVLLTAKSPPSKLIFKVSWRMSSRFFLITLRYLPLQEVSGIAELMLSMAKVRT
jgi:hypothetical protein